MKAFNLHATQQPVYSITQIYGIILSILTLGLTAYTYYILYKVSPLSPVAASVPAPVPRSALYHCVKVLEKIPHTVHLTALTINQELITITGKQEESIPLTSWLQELAKNYAIVNTKRAHDGMFILELKITA